MAQRRMAVILLLCLCLVPCLAQAASTADAREPIAVTSDCTLTLAYRAQGADLAQVPVKLYPIATVSADFQYTLLAPYDASGLVVNGIQTLGEWNIVRSTLEARILADQVEPARTAATDAAGQVRFEGLQPGLYLADAQSVVLDGYTYVFDSALIALPGLGEDGLWQYQVTVQSKSAVIPPVEPDETIELKVLKLWKGDTSSKRPASIEVELFRDGVSTGTVTLSKANNWTYTWSALDDGSVWTVVERKVPSGYTMTLEKKNNDFVLTNILKDTPPPDSPQTGDTSDIVLYAVLMFLSGCVLILLAITGRRKRHEEEQ